MNRTQMNTDHTDKNKNFLLLKIQKIREICVP